MPSNRPMQEAAYAPFRGVVGGLAETGEFPERPFHAARDFADTLIRTMDLARGFAASGRRVDLTGLEGQVGLLCAKSLDLPPEQGRLLREDLIHLLAELDALAEVLGQPAPDA